MGSSYVLVPHKFKLGNLVAHQFAGDHFLVEKRIFGFRFSSFKIEIQFNDNRTIEKDLAKTAKIRNCNMARAPTRCCANKRHL